MRRLKNQLSKMALIMAFLMVAWVGTARADFDYQITVNTSALLGTSGYIDMQLNPGTTSAPAAFATLSSFSSDATLQSPSQVIGAVTGSLPGGLLFSNATPLNDYLQPVVFGNTTSFNLAFSGPFQSVLSGSDSRFSLSLYDPSFNSLLTIDPAGTILQFELVPKGGVTPTTFPADLLGTPTVASVSAVPIPAALPLFLSGLGALLIFGRGVWFSPNFRAEN